MEDLEELELINRKIFRRFLVIFLPALFIFSGLMLYIRYTNHTNLLASYKSEEQTEIRIKHYYINSMFRNVISDLFYLANKKRVSQFLTSNDTQLKANLVRDFMGFSESKRMYDQIRLLDLNGMEVIRINSYNGFPVNVPDEELQNKSNRYYFSESMDLNEGEIYMSPLDLNVEKGHIEVPYKPVLRISTPIFNEKDTLIGILVLNYLASNIIERFAERNDPKSEYFILSHNGHYLYNKDPGKTWGFMFESLNAVTVKNDNPELWEIINKNTEGSTELNGNIHVFSRINLFHTYYEIMGIPVGAFDVPQDNTWYVISTISRDWISDQTKKSDLTLILFWMVLSISIGAGTWFMAGARIKELKYNEKIRESNNKLRQQTEELKASEEELREQQHELQITNQHLEEQTEKLEVSEEELRSQQEELVYSNKILEEKSIDLQKKSEELTEAKKILEIKNNDLETASKYKSEFLANMSHELRTPLNSILLLSQLLAGNNEENLTEDQVESARVIYQAGEGLLQLINEILDLAKIESGKMLMEFKDVRLSDIMKSMENIFKPVTLKKDIDFRISVEENVPKTIRTDQQRLEQVLKNLLSNAIKFTQEGNVELRIFKPSVDTIFKSDFLASGESVGFAVSDTGIGIHQDHQKLVFEAFKQADGSTQRKYGGTGLGLSICREIARLFGGEIQLESTIDKGSTFTLFLPENCEELHHNISDVTTTLQSGIGSNGLLNSQLEIPDEIPDDRNNILRNEKTILIIEDDLNFAGFLLNFVRERGYKGIVAVRGDKGLEFANKFNPMAIFLDINLPVMDGWKVMEELKKNSETRTIPVHMFSSGDNLRQRSLEIGAIDFTGKPVSAEHLKLALTRIESFCSKEVKSILIVDENEIHQQSLYDYLGNHKWNIYKAGNAKQALDELGKREIDCMVLDMELPDDSGFKVLETIKENEKYSTLPVIVYTGKNISPSEEKKIRYHASSIIIKTAHSYERLKDELTLFLHVVKHQKESRQKQLPYNAGDALRGKCVLLIDDDVRNIFSLTGLLEERGMEVISAENGKEALELMDKIKVLDVVLTDIMMPVMDGYETIKEIRKSDRFRDLPIIAVTAKAMTTERDKCIKAGASDYLSKPVDADQLLSLLRVWLYNNK